MVQRGHDDHKGWLLSHGLVIALRCCGTERA